MNNTELTLNQLAEVAGGAPHITTYGGSGLVTKVINGIAWSDPDRVHCFRGKQARKLETRIGGSADPGGDDV